MKTWRNLIDHHKPKSHLLSSWHIPEDVRFGGGGCRGGFWPQEENSLTGVNGGVHRCTRNSICVQKSVNIYVLMSTR